MPTWIDAHCHLADPRFAADLPDVLARSRAAGVSAWLQGGVSPDDWALQRGLAGLYPGVLPVYGLHPWWAAEKSAAEISEALAALRAAAPAAAAIGETGLDAMPKRAEGMEGQRRAFAAQLALARELSKPLILHVVKAHEPALELLESAGPFPRGGLVHAFSAGAETAGRYARRGFLISVGAAVLKEGREDLKAAVRSLAPERLVLETDAPDQAPEKGTRNEPANLVRIARAAAALRGENHEALLARSAENLKRLLEIA